jgi:uncharacterized protein YjaG (DUF416 family)
MSYAVVHMKKLSAPVIKGVQFHHQREKESKTNPDIDYYKSNLNYDLINSKPINFNQQVNKVIKENVVTNKAIRKDAVVLCDFIVTSDKGFFKGLSQEDQKKFFDKSCEFFQDKYGKQNVLYAKVHLDELTPHMHLGLVPITEDKKLSAKKLFDRKGLRDIQEEYPKFIRKYGFDLERGEPKGTKRIETQEYKKQQVQKLEEQLIKTTDTLKFRLEGLQDAQISLNDLEHVQIKRTLLGGKMTLSAIDLDKIMNLAKNGIANSSELKDLKKENDILKSENKNLKTGINTRNDKMLQLRNKNMDLVKNLKNALEKNKVLIETLKIHDLIPEAQQRFDTLKEEQKNDLKTVKKSRDFGLDR